MDSRKNHPSRNSKPTVSSANATQLKKAIQWIVNKSSFSNVTLHGNVKWAPHQLVMLIVLWAWSDRKQMTNAFDDAAQRCQRLFDVLSVATFQGMMRALVVYSPQMLPCLWTRFQTLMQQVAPADFRIGKWLPLAVDGSRFDTPRTSSNEQAFAAKNYGHGKQALSRAKWKKKNRRSKKLSAPVKPQIWLTLIMHMGLKLPWCWKTGPSNASERDHLLELIETLEFPENTLFCGDAGFTGYEFWSRIIEQGHHFLVRVGANVRLLKNLGYVKQQAGIVCLWPHAAAKKKQPPLVLRLIEIKNERGSLFLVTNVLSERQLSTSTLRRLYPLRWGIEVHFRAMKQTYGRRKLRSRNANHAVAELEWSLVALTMIQLLCLREQQKTDVRPDQISIALACSAIRNALDDWPQSPRSQTLNRQLRLATKDTYHRTTSKSARYRPTPTDKPTNKGPQIVIASNTLKQIAKTISQAA